MFSRKLSIGVALILLLQGLAWGQEESSIDAALYSVGSLSASNVYLSYLVLGTVADAYSQGLYTADVATSITNEALYLNANARDSLDELLRTKNLSDEDYAVLERIRTVYNVLEQEGEALVRFISDPSDSGEEFQTYRSEAWAQISELLGISSEE